MWGNNPLLPREKHKCMSSLQIVGCYAREGVGMVRSCLSLASPTHFDVSFFLIGLCIQVAQLVLDFFSKRKLFHV